MLPKQKTKAELKQQVEELTQRLPEAEERYDGDVESQRDEALGRAEEAERQVLDTECELTQVKRQLEEARHVRGHVSRDRVREAESDLATSRERVRRLELDLDDANNRIDQLEWRPKQRELDSELRVAKAQDRARKDHRKERAARDDLITLLKEKLQRSLSAEVRPSDSGSGC